MAALFNALSCGNYDNTGMGGSCPFDPSLIAGGFAIPKGFVIPAASMTTTTVFNAYLAARLVSDARSTRFFELPWFTNFENKTGDPVTVAMNNYEATVQDKPYNFMFRWGKASFCQYTKAKAIINGQQDRLDILYYDDMGNIFGVRKLDSTGTAYGLGGFSMFEIHVDNWSPKTANDLPLYTVSFKHMLNSEFNENVRFMASNFTVNTGTQTLTDVVLEEGTGTVSATHVFVKGTMGCGATSLGATWGSTLAVTGAWLVNNASTGAAITVSAVSYNSTTETYDLTITSTPAADVIVGMAAPSVLIALGCYLVVETPNKVTITTP